MLEKVPEASRLAEQVKNAVGWILVNSFLSTIFYTIFIINSLILSSILINSPVYLGEIPEIPSPKTIPALSLFASAAGLSIIVKNTSDYRLLGVPLKYTKIASWKISNPDLSSEVSYDSSEDGRLNYDHNAKARKAYHQKFSDEILSQLPLFLTLPMTMYILFFGLELKPAVIGIFYIVFGVVISNTDSGVLGIPRNFSNLEEQVYGSIISQIQVLIYSTGAFFQIVGEVKVEFTELLVLFVWFVPVAISLLLSYRIYQITVIRVRRIPTVDRYMGFD